MKKALLLLVLPLLFVAACNSNNNTNSGTTPKTDPTPSTDPEPTPTPVATTKMTTIGLNEIYFDFNFTTPIEGFKIKVGNEEYTTSGKQTLKKNETYVFEGTPSKAYNIYSAIESNGVTNGSASTGVSVDGLKTIIERNLNKFAKFESDYRIYFCITDTEKGWSKTIPGVDEIISSYTGTGPLTLS